MTLSSSRADGTPPRPDPALFLISGSLLLVALLVGLAREQHWGEPHFQVQLRAASADGLRPGMQVRLLGLPVGRLNSLAMQPDATVAVTLQIQERYRPLIGPGSHAYQGQDGFVGDHYVAITPRSQPSAGGPLAETPQTLPYEQPLDMRNLMIRLTETRLELNKTLENTNQLTAKDLPKALDEFRRTMVAINRLSTTLEGETKRTAPPLRQTLAQTAHTLGSVDSLSSTVEREATQTAPHLRRTIAQAERTLGSVNRLSSTVEREVKQTAPQLQRTVTSAEQVAGEANLLLRDSRPTIIQILKDIQSLTSSTNRLLQSFLGTEALDQPKSASPR
jgi:phospholipid/cholesterol/gamma-HCH transport system substrate-binding protein